MESIYVIWQDQSGGKRYSQFKTEEMAYDFMVKKLSAGCWACMPANTKVYKQETIRR